VQSGKSATTFNASVFGDPETNPVACYTSLIDAHPSAVVIEAILFSAKEYGDAVVVAAIKEGKRQGKDRWCWIAKDILPGIVEAHKPPEPRKPSGGMAIAEANMELERQHLARREAKRLEQQKECTAE
jgi:hypothetical protein